jgi:phenylpyruvate tautomerase PptA (4-oxalocrotonate tautomerase family)
LFFEVFFGEVQNDYFQCEDRIIWMTQYDVDGINVKLFKDDKLKAQEQQDYLQRISSIHSSIWNAKKTQISIMQIVLDIETRDYLKGVTQERA